ncbi:MAG TPA: sigma-70 family RNA polymerase sigma factor [Fimbriimonadaceae bacterium]|nr:sigma-70 family RNA polymerase sigma factor [Fimbriimonadaceae bacterium]
MSEGLTRNKQDGEALVAKYLEDPRSDLKDLIIVHYAPMVERIARKFRGIEHVDDLTQVGYIGLLNALSKFDPAAGVRFNTYATHLVAGEIKHFLRDRSQTIRQPAWLQELRHKVQKAATSLQAQTGRMPDEREIAELIGVSESAVREVYATQELLKVGSLDGAPMDDEDADTDIDRLDSAHFCPEQMSVEDRVVLEMAMQQLRDLEREILVMFHFDALNQTEIAHRLGISCNYVSHILRQSLAKLRRILTEEDALDLMLRKDAPKPAQDVIDPVTGIYNEDYFRSRLTEEVHRIVGSDGVLSVILIEFTGLRSLAGFYGDTGITDFLTDAAVFLKGLARTLDIVCRNGSAGFGVILPSTGPTVVAVKQRFEDSCKSWLVTRVAPNGPIVATVGYATAPDDGTTVSDLLKTADPRFRRDEAA